MAAITGGLTNEIDFTVKGHTAEVLKLLLDPESMGTEQVGGDETLILLLIDHHTATVTRKEFVSQLVLRAICGETCGCA